MRTVDPSSLFIWCFNSLNRIKADLRLFSLFVFGPTVMRPTMFISVSLKQEINSSVILGEKPYFCG